MSVTLLSEDRHPVTLWGEALASLAESPRHDADGQKLRSKQTELLQKLSRLPVGEIPEDFFGNNADSLDKDEVLVRDLINVTHYPSLTPRSRRENQSARSQAFGALLSEISRRRAELVSTSATTPATTDFGSWGSDDE